MSSSDSESLSSGSLTLAFTRSDFARLLEIEAQTLQRRQAAATASKDAAGAGTSGVSVSASSSGGEGASSADECSVATADESSSFASKIDQLSSLINEGAGGEDEWAELMQADEYALYQALLVIMSVVPLPVASFQTLVQTLYILSTLDPAQVYRLAAAHPGAVDALLASIAPELEAADLGARFRLLDLLLLESAKPAHTDLPLRLRCDMDVVQRQLMECLANPSTSVFALAASNMLLLDTIDTKRTLHRVLLGKQAELAVSPHSSSAPSPSPAHSPPASPLSNHSFSRFGQELVTLVNAGRLPAQWVEEEEVTQKHSGTSHGGDGDGGLPEDMYESTRAVVRALPERDPTCDALTSAALAFLSQLFHTNTALDLLYTNDIRVLVEVLLQRMEDQQENAALTLASLLCLSAIVAWEEFVSDPFKLNEIRALLQSLLVSFPEAPHLSADQTAAMTPAERDEAESRQAVHELAQIMSSNVAKL